MRIGILTQFHKSINYGGVLQAYALCKYLNNRGHSASQVLYSPNVVRISGSSVTIKEILMKAFKWIGRIFHHKTNNQIRKRMESLFVDFRDDVPHTQQVYSKSTIGEAVKDFDVFIAGSDQIWNPMWYDSTYMLDFVEDSAKKLSYAASMGVVFLDDEQKRIFKTQLSDFMSISVREKATADILSLLIDRTVEVSVDPTLLLSANEWDEIASERRVKEKYVFLYLLGDDKKTRKLAEKFVKHKGLKLVLIPDLLGVHRAHDSRISGEKILDATPHDFISLIKYAEFVITDSFHACVFSLIYQKEFFVFERTDSKKMSLRIQNLTGLFECPERFCTTKHERSLEYLLTLQPIDYSKDYRSFLKEKQKSMDYLETHLE